MDPSQRMEFCSNQFIFFERFVSVLEPLIKISFDVPSAQMSIFTLFANTGVSF